jgi:hypothetical protein
MWTKVGGEPPPVKTQDDAGGDPGILRGGWTAFLAEAQAGGAESVFPKY